MTAFRIPTRTVFGPGSLGRLEPLSAGTRGAVALVTDPGVRATPGFDRAVKALSDRRVIVLDDVLPNPRADAIDAMADAVRGRDVGLVVALGGGSALDAGKGVALLLTNPGSCRDYAGRNRFKSDAAPLVAIPTTCGTGSEVTWVSVISDAERRTKISVKGDGLFPRWALVDGDLLRTLPAHLVASTGMDALTHAVEAYVGRASNPASDAMAEAAVRQLFAYLPRAFGRIGEDDEAREGVMRASTLAGMAFGSADVGGVHCLSEAIGGRHDLPHGLLNAVLLTPVVRYHGEAASDRLAALDAATGGAGSAEAMLDRIEVLGRTVEIPVFGELGVPPDDYDAIAADAEANGSNASNPRDMAAADYRAILDALA